MESKEEMAKLILNEMKDIAADNDLSLKDDINRDTVLLETGLDSLGFARLVVALETELGYDPFTITDEPVYPTTFGDLVDIYWKYAE